VHVAGGFAPNAVALATSYPDTVASMTLVCPMQLPTEPFMPASVPLLVFFGDRGSSALTMPGVLASFPETSGFTLRDYEGEPWSDAVADRRHDMWPAILSFLSDTTQRDGLDPASVPEGAGEVEGITFRVRGSGPPLLLLPLSLARSQWEPFTAVLAERYTTIVVGGPHLGVVPLLEGRMQGGYRKVVRSVVDAAQPRRGEKIVEVGCGPGAVAGWLARYLPAKNEITAVDVNGYLLREAALLTDAEGMTNRITFQEGDAEALPLDSDSFDITLSFTVMEEVDADRMLAEMVRVTRPGGRVGVVVRATDMPRFLNVPLPAELRSKELVISPPYFGTGERGCGDASLYRRFVDAGLTNLEMGPQLAPD
jgi:SAM-dependent methyltransferase